MNKIRFFIALWAGKLLLFVWKRIGRERDDKPGMASVRLCENFLEQIRKPKLTIAVTGTNGKTSISSMVTDMLRRQGMTVAYNDWGANHHAGQARCLLETVNIFNRSIKDAAVVESDELISPIDIPRVKPDYLIVNNVARDSMLRNANPEYIAEQLKKACDASPDTVVIVNANDPLCCFDGENNRRIYFGADDLHYEPYNNVAKDFRVCPECGSKVDYVYRNYRHIGHFECNTCGLSTPESDYFAMKVSKKDNSFVVKEKDGEFTYPLVSATTHSVYNTTAMVALMRDLGNTPEQVAKLLSETHLPEYRETKNKVNGINIICVAAKGQNATAVSTIFEQVAKDPSDKEIVIMLDEIYENPKKLETIAWIYDTDYEFLNRNNVRRIVIGGPRCKDHLVRFLISGMPEEKIKCTENLDEVADLVDGKDVESIFVLYDINSVEKNFEIRDRLIERFKRGGENNAR